LGILKEKPLFEDILRGNSAAGKSTPGVMGVKRVFY